MENQINLMNEDQTNKEKKDFLEKPKEQNKIKEDRKEGIAAFVLIGLLIGILFLVLSVLKKSGKPMVSLMEALPMINGINHQNEKTEA